MDKVAFSLSFSIDASAAACSYALKDRATDTVIDERHSFLNHARMTIPFCRAPSTFALVLRKNDTSGWGSNRVSVVLADGSVLLTESLAAGVTEKEKEHQSRTAPPGEWRRRRSTVEGI